MNTGWWEFGRWFPNDFILYILHVIIEGNNDTSKMISQMYDNMNLCCMLFQKCNSKVSAQTCFFLWFDWFHSNLPISQLQKSFRYYVWTLSPILKRSHTPISSIYDQQEGYHCRSLIVQCVRYPQLEWLSQNMLMTIHLQLIFCLICNWNPSPLLDSDPFILPNK